MSTWLTRLTGLFPPFRSFGADVPIILARFDDFNRANETPVNLPSDGGSAWIPLYLHGAGGLAVSSNRLANLGDGGFYAYGLDCGTNNGRVGIILADLTNLSYVRLVLRANPGSPTNTGDFICVQWVPSTGAVAVFIWIGFATSSTQLASGVTMEAGDLFEASVGSDHVYHAYVNGEEIGSGQLAGTPSRNSAYTYFGVGSAGYPQSYRFDDFQFVPETTFSVEVDGDVIVDGEDDPRAGMIDQNSTAETQSYTLRNYNLAAEPIGQITAPGLTLVDDPSDTEIPAGGYTTLTVRLSDTSTLGYFPTTITIPYSNGDFTIRHHSAVIVPANRTGLAFSMGNSLTGDTLHNDYLDDNPFGPGNLSGNHLHPGWQLFNFVSAPYDEDGGSTLWKPCPWPVALTNGKFRWLCLQPYTFDAETNTTAASTIIDASDPDTDVCITRSWPTLSGWDASYASNKDTFDTIVSNLTEAYPERTVVQTRMDEIMNYVKNDPDAPEGMWAIDENGSSGVVGLFRDDLHTSALGQWLANNAERRAIGQPILEELEGADRDTLSYLIGVLDQFLEPIQFTQQGQWTVPGSPSSYAINDALPTNGAARQGGFNVGFPGPRLTTDANPGYYLTPSAADGRAFHQQLITGGSPSVGGVFWLRVGEIADLDTKRLTIAQVLAVNNAYVPFRLYIGADREFIAYRINFLDPTGVTCPVDEWVMLKFTVVTRDDGYRRSAAWIGYPERGDTDWTLLADYGNYYTPSNPPSEGVFSAIEIGPRSDSQDPAPIALATDLRIGALEWYIGDEYAAETTIPWPSDVELGRLLANGAYYSRFILSRRRS